MKNTLFSIFCFLLIASIGNAQKSGSLDTTFNKTGKVFYQIATGTAYFHRAHSIASNEDRIYVVGSYAGEAVYGMGILALKKNGIPDSAFSNDGRLVITSGVPDDDFEAWDVALQNDGKIIVGGHSPTGILVVRLNVDGSLDNSWDGDGIAKTNVTAGIEMIRRLLIQQDGKIIAAGWAGVNVNDGIAVRYNTNGTIDQSFANNGIFQRDYGSGERINAVAQQSDGKIIFAGESVPNTASPKGFLNRLTIDGQPDPSFGDNGEVKIIEDAVEAIAVLPSKKIICATYRSVQPGVYQLNEDGSPDTSFDNDGLMLPDQQMILTSVIARSGKIYLTGYHYEFSPTKRDFSVLSLNGDGSVAKCFATDGLLKFDVGNSKGNVNTTDYSYTGIMQSDGKILLVGEAQNSGVPHYEFAVARVTTGGPAFISSQSVTICQGETYQFGNEMLTEAGEYQKTFTTVDGCDSLVTLKLSITEINNGVTQDGSTLIADEVNGSYQWLSEDETIIVDATSKEFTPTESGKYAVMVSRDGCSVTSVYTSVIITSTDEAGSIEPVYPNPFKERIQINLPKRNENTIIKLQDINGRTINTWSAPHTRNQILLEVAHINDGIYVLQISTGRNVRTVRVAKHK